MVSNLYSELTSLLKVNFFYKIDFCYNRYQIEVFRILIAAFCIINFTTILLDYDVILAPNGLIGWEVTNANSFWFELHPQKLADFFGIAPDILIKSVSVIYIVALTMLMLGVLPNLSAIISLVCFTLITDVITPYAYGMDIYQSVFLFFLCFFPVGYSFSIMNKKPKNNLITIQKLSTRTLQLYLIITYLSAGFEKAVMSGWWNGKFIFFLVNDPTIITSSLIPTQQPIWFYMIFGMTVVLAESLYFIFIWIKGFRIWLFFLIVSMHMFIALFMNLFFFGLLLILANISCWYPAICSDLKLLKTNDQPI